MRIKVPNAMPLPEPFHQALPAGKLDVVGGIFDEAMLGVRSCAGLELLREPFCCAVSVHHKS